MSTNCRKSFLVTAVLLLAVCMVAPAMAATTQVQIVKYANDGTTILNQTTVNYTWMMNNLPVLGDGTTHYYHQGPVFIDDANETLEQELRWNPEEDTNVDTKDMGAVKGTNVKDLCDLVGGMSPGEEVKLLAVDGWSDMYDYKNVYEYSSREGPIGITWLMNGMYPDSGYSDGMRMVWFADDSVNPWGIHAFGNYDWHEAAAPEYWYYYQSGGENYPTTTGLSGKYINRIYIYSDDPVPTSPEAAFTSDVQSGDAPLTVQFTDQSTGTSPFTYAWDFEDDGTVDSTEQSPSHIYDTAGSYTVNLTVTNAGGSDSEVKTDYITVTAAGPKTWYVDDSGGADFTTIQAAVDAASDGDTIIVRDGTYVENVVVGKSLTIQSENGRDATTVQAGSSIGFTITASPVTIRGFTITGTSMGIYSGDSSWSVTNSTITDNNISGFGANAGMRIYRVNSSTITGNICNNNLHGIMIEGAQCTVDNNICSDNSQYGIFLTAGGGSGSGKSRENIVSSNTLSGNLLAGILIYRTQNNTITGNTFSNNQYGIQLRSSGTSTVQLATLNEIYQNNFINSTTSHIGFYDATGNTGNIWNSQSPVSYTYNGVPYSGYTGNYWSGYTGADTDGNGIGDTANQTRATPDEFDNYPLIGEWNNGVITYTPPAVISPVAAFISDVQTGTAPLTVQFTDESTNAPTSWAWDVDNDGTVDYATQNATHTYTAAGNYTVNLTVANEAGSDSEVKTDYITVTSPPSIDELFNGTVTLTEGETFTVTAYNNASGTYTVNYTTPLGALETASKVGSGFTYDVTDKNYASSGALLLDNIGTYLYQKTPRKAWYGYVNDVYKDGYNNPAGALNLIGLNDGDTVEFYFVNGTVADPTDYAAVTAAASAAVKIAVDIQPAGPVVDTLFDGTVTLTPDTTFTVTAYNTGGGTYTVNYTTPLGALETASKVGSGFSYDVTDKNFASSGALLLDNIGTYLYQKTPRKAWYGYVNDVYKDGYNNPAGALNLIALNDGDTVEFYFVNGTVADPTDYAAVTAAASAAVKITADIDGSTPTEPDWTLSLSGARSQSVTKTYFEQGLACPSSGHMVSYTDGEGSVWSGVPLWLLVAMVDDNPDSGPDHFNFNDALAAEGYSVKVTAGDGYEINFESADIARNNDYIVANTLDGTALPLLKPNSTKLCFPLQMIGPAVSSGQLVGNITSIELVGLPEPPAGWTLTMEGDVVDVITQQYFEEGIACHHNTTWTDGSGNVWSGVLLWELAGAVDDIETSSHWTFNDTRAASGYTLRVIAGDGYNKTFASTDVARSSNYLVANIKNGEPLSGTEAPLRLVGANATGGKSVGAIATIRLEGLPSYPAGDWSLQLDGVISDTIPQPEFEDWASCHSATYDDGAGNVYEGIPLWRLMGWVDDRIPHGSNGFNNALANAGYKVIVTAGDGYSKELTSQQIGTTDGFIIANTLNGQPLPTDGSHPPYPLRLVGAGLPSASYSVGNLVSIELTDFQEPTEIPTVTIIKYASDGTTIIDQTTVDHVWMEANLPVVGDGVTHYLYQGVTFDPADLWDPTETKGMTPPKIDNAIKATKVRDLCELVGGMEPGTEIKFVATDGYETTLPYDAIYPNPHVSSHLGESVIAWYADGNYVPQYGDGPRLFFAPEDHVVGQWNMHEALPEQYWHYYWDGGVQYPSVAGLSAKFISTIKIYSAPVTDWSLVLDGEDIGGLNQTISRNYFESAIACQFGANHEAEYTDSAGRTWSGMPLWFLCGFVDDADQHSDNAYNETMAQDGYNITVIATDGYSVTFDSRDTVRSTNYIVANSLNGTPISESDSSWPLRLVGQNVTGSKIVKKVAAITLESIESQPPIGEREVYLSPSSSPVANGMTTDYEIRVSSLPEGLAGYDLIVTVDTPTIAEITEVQYPGWAVLSNTTPSVPADSLRLSGVDIAQSIEAGAGDTLLATITVRADSTGTSAITLSSVNMDADGGALITPSAVTSGEIVVYIPMVADFEANVTSGKASTARPLFVAFTDLSNGVPPDSSWSWDFDNNGVADSILQNPVTSYTTPGNYTVSLTVQNAYSSDIETKSEYIQVTSYVKPFPGMTNEPTDPDGDFLYEDINGNGRLDYDDIVMYYENMQWIRDQADVDIEAFDYNQNGRIDYDDIVVLYQELLAGHP